MRISRSLTIGSIDLTPLVLNGWIGVDLFFVLSGFLIGRQAWRGDSLLRFWFKRVTRILPAYWACLAVVAIGLTIAGAWPKSGADFLAHLVMLQDYTGSVFVPAFWSLGAEEKFYLLAPLFVFVLARARGAGVAGWRSAGAVALPGDVASGDSGQPHRRRDLRRVYPVQYRSPFHMTCESLVSDLRSPGCRCSRGPHASPVRFVRRSSGLVPPAWRIGSCSSVILSSIDARTIVLAPALIGLCFGAMVLACVMGSGSYSTVFGWRMWRPLATGSYTLYLTHMMVLPVAGVLAALFPLASGASIAARWLAFVPWYLALSAAAAYLLHRYVERPVLVWRDRRLHAAADSPHTGTVARAA